MGMRTAAVGYGLGVGEKAGCLDALLLWAKGGGKAAMMSIRYVFISLSFERARPSVVRPNDFEHKMGLWDRAGYVATYRYFPFPVFSLCSTEEAKVGNKADEKHQ